MAHRQCPKCKVKMDHLCMVGVEFESCGLCTGVWLDKGELAAITRSRGGDALRVSINEAKRTEYFCPVCQPRQLLLEGTHNLSDEFELDICPKCEGLWFDRGEFPSLLKSR